MQSILERAGTVGYQGNDADERAVAELAEDVRDAVIEYQVSPNLLVIFRIRVEATSSSVNRTRYMSRIVD